MTKSEFYTGFKSLFENGKQPTLGDALDLMNKIAEDYDRIETLTTEAGVTKTQLQTLETENNNLRQTNYKLFMSVGEDILEGRPGAGKQTTPLRTPNTNTSPTPTQEDPITQMFAGIEEPGDKEINSLLSAYTNCLDYQTPISAPITETRRPDQSIATTGINSTAPTTGPASATSITSGTNQI